MSDLLGPGSKTSPSPFASRNIKTTNTQRGPGSGGKLPLGPQGSGGSKSNEVHFKKAASKTLQKYA